MIVISYSLEFNFIRPDTLEGKMVKGEKVVESAVTSLFRSRSTTSLSLFHHLHAIRFTFTNKVKGKQAVESAEQFQSCLHENQRVTILLIVCS
jgi:hypothetical protein